MAAPTGDPRSPSRARRWLGAGLAGVLLACGAPPSAGPDASLAPDGGAAPDAGGALAAMSVQALHDALGADGGKGFLLIDVHVPRQGDIPGTDRDIAYTDLDALAAYLGADLDTPAVLYCMSNAMSVAAGRGLVARGYRAIRYLDGGMGAWMAAGYPIDP